MAEPDPVLRALAEAYSISVEYWDWQHRHAPVDADTVIKVLAALDVDASTPAAVEAALQRRALEPWTRMLPPCLVVRQGHAATVDVHVPHGEPVGVWIDLETGQRWHSVHQQENWKHPVTVDGRLVGEATFAVPGDLPLGYHTLCAESAGRAAAMSLIVTPSWLGLPERIGERRLWGLATQLYSVRSRESWGVGDLVDLEDLAVWSTVRHGAGYVLVNPLHAAEPVTPMEPSPYLPTTRRFANPIYLRVERIPEYAVLGAHDRDRVRRLHEHLRGDPRVGDTIDRDASWAAKRAALQLVFAVGRSAGRELAFRAYRAREGDGLLDFATWCALAEEHGPDWSSWPEALQDLEHEEVHAFRMAHPERVDFHCWLQWALDDQLAAAQASARRAGMDLGIVHDLAVGVHPRGSDTWSLPDVYARGISVGAPPDAYNQNGQNWTQPPWRPDRLAEAAYAPFRELVSTVLRHAGGVRVDHVIGLFRLWWIPDGAVPTAGAYVRYDHEALVGILALEAYRAGAVVVGEDLGTVEPWVRSYLRDRGILGTSILWFEFDHDTGETLEPERWRSLCLASVTTHDLPPTAGYLDGQHVRLRERLGLLTRPLAEELEVDQRDREAWLDALRSRGLLPDQPDTATTVAALHRFLTLTPARLLCVSLADAVGDRRIQNQPGTSNEYPNWRVPLSDGSGRPVLLEDLFTSPGAAQLVEVVHVD